MYGIEENSTGTGVINNGCNKRKTLFIYFLFDAVLFEGFFKCCVISIWLK